MIQDLRYAVRVLFKSKALTIVALLTLALGIGVNSAIFSVVNAIVLRPLPYPRSEDLVVVWGNLHKKGLEEIEISALEFRDFQQQCQAFDQIAAYTTAGLNLTGVDQPERLRGAAISANLFPTLGVQPHLGRNIATEEDQYGNDRVVVLSHSLWQRRFGGDPGVINRTIQLDGRTVSVVGVMPADFHFPDRETELWIPLAFEPDLMEENNRGSHFLNVIARLKPSVTAAQAQADLNTVTTRLSNEHTSTYRSGFSTSIRSLHEELVGNLRRAMLVLLGAVALVLLIACANVAHLRLASATARYREFAIRAALGARRARVIRQFLTESVLLSLVGGAVGLALAVWVVRVLVLLMPKDTPRVEEIKLDYRVVLFTLGISILTGIVFGLAPAFQASKTNLNDVLKEAGRSGSDTSRRLRLRNLLVISEFALSLVLLIGAGLLIKSLVRLQDVNPGFQPSKLMTMRIALPATKYAKFNQSHAFFEQLFDRLEARAGIESVGAINLLPFGGGGGDRSFSIEDQPVPEGHARPDEQVRFITPGYFHTMQIPLLSGREFTRRDLPDTPPVAIVNNAFARKFWADGNAIGKRISFSANNPKWYEIVGIAGNVKHRGLDVAESPELYIPAFQPLFADGNVPALYVAVRTVNDPLAAATAMRSEVAAIDRDQPVSSLLTMEQRISDSVAPRRFNMFILGLFAALALVLAAIGIYGIMAFSVVQRTHEIGVRMALGANQSDVLKLVLRNGFMLALIGIVVGLLAAFAATRVLASLLYDVSATDPLIFVIDAVLLAVAALFACYIPARRATKVDPLVALRYE
ncbi:MAG TPA: ABC transporter permease [Pyrinomonadaceae bacterium]|nr:ABC transporter permease [Pyrinomonadaceae bacterium]